METDSMTANANLDEIARLHDLAPRMLYALARVTAYEVAMDHEFSQALRAEIRAILKEARGQ